jgi:hypothetical protein
MTRQGDDAQLYYVPSFVTFTAHFHSSIAQLLFRFISNPSKRFFFLHARQYTVVTMDECR